MEWFFLLCINGVDYDYSVCIIYCILSSNNLYKYNWISYLKCNVKLIN